MQLSKKQNVFSVFFALFVKTTSNVEQIFKKIILIAYLFSKLRTAKEVVR